uniref:hypothetical protein n=1 Tax=Nonomuraea sp. CA-251285 TaxID=3240002 RepID=UPI003F4985F1
MSETRRDTIDLTGLEGNVSELSFDGNTAAYGTRRWHPSRVLKVRRHSPSGLWYITCGGQVYNHLTGDWDEEWTFQHEPQEPYLLQGNPAVTRARELLQQALFSHM